MPTASTRELYRRLRELRFGPGKPDERENLLDVLELCAVNEGTKPAHLQGHGQYDAGTMTDIEQIASACGLRVRRTHSFPPWRHRPYRGDQDYWQWCIAGEPAKAQSEPVLWVCGSNTDDNLIDDVLASRIPVGQLLGYPSCCELHSAERGMLLTEELERGFREQHSATTTADLIRCNTADVGVATDFDMSAGIPESLTAYPFVQFFACPDCLRDRGSPASKLNNRMRHLARDLDRELASELNRGP